MPAGARLFNVKKGAKTLRFPMELGTDEVPNYITFRPEAVDFGTIKGSSSRENYGNAFKQKSPLSRAQTAGVFDPLGNVAGKLLNPFQQLRNDIGGIVDGLAQGANAALSAIANPFNMLKVSVSGDVKLGKLFKARIDIGNLFGAFGSSSASIRQSGAKLIKLPGINLYLPPDIKHSTNADYGEQKLGAAGQTAIDMVDTGFYYTQEGTFQGAGIESAKALLTAAVNDVASSGRLGAAVQRATGRVANNYTYTIFNGMKHRSFNYNFTLVAKSPEESKIIKDVCDSFMFYMLPQRSNDMFHMYDVPCMWDIGYYRQGEELIYLDQPNKCFLTKCDIAYGGDTQGQLYNDGAPITVKLSLSFTEIEPLHRTDNDRLATSSSIFSGNNDITTPNSGPQ